MASGRQPVGGSQWIAVLLTFIVLYFSVSVPVSLSRAKLERLDAVSEYKKRSETGKELINLIVIGTSQYLYLPVLTPVSTCPDTCICMSWHLYLPVLTPVSTCPHTCICLCSVPGHVDAGKSTLMGHLLYQLGVVSQRQMHRQVKSKLHNLLLCDRLHSLKPHVITASNYILWFIPASLVLPDYIV